MPARLSSKIIPWLAVIGLITFSIFPDNQGYIKDLFKPAEATHGSGAHTIIMWDGSGSAPTGWSYVSDSGGAFYQKMPRGAATYGGTGGANTHAGHTVSYVSAAAGTGANSSKAGTTFDITAHTHTSISSPLLLGDTSLPPYRNLRFIQYDAGIATTIPSGGIIIFDAAVPSGFTRYSAQDNTFIRGEDSSNVGGTGGAATNQHTVLATLDGSASATTGSAGASTVRATDNHTHSISGVTATGDHTPLHVEVILGKANSNQTVADGMIAMFDASPTGLWSVKSGSGGVFENSYLEGKSAYATAQGATTHTHANGAITSGGPSTTAASITGGSSNSTALSTHTHSVTLSYSTDTNAPAYVDVIIAKYEVVHTPEMRNWRWYDAEDTQNPANTNGSDTATGDALASENTAPSSTRIIYKGNYIKLRIAIGEVGGVSDSSVWYRLEYDESTDFTSTVLVNSTWINAGCASGLFPNSQWLYGDGSGATDGATISTLLLSGTNSAGKYEDFFCTADGSNASAQYLQLAPSASTNYEVEFTIWANTAAVNYPTSQTKYFRLEYCLDLPTTTCTGGWQNMQKNASYDYPSITTAAAFDLEIAQAPANVSLGATGNDTHSYTFVAGEEIAFWDKRGSLASYDVTVASMTMDLDGGGDSIPGTDITWTSTVAVLNRAFDSSIDHTGNNGQNMSATLNAYSAASSSDQVNRGGFYFLPTIDFVNLSTQTGGNYTGDLVITIL